MTEKPSEDDDEEREPEPSSDEDDEDEDAPEPTAPIPSPSYVFLVVTSAVFLALDLGTKYWALQELTQKPRIHVIDEVLMFDLIHNKGGAGGVLGQQPDHIRLPFFFLISVVAVIFIISLYRKLEPQQTALKWALPLVLGGALGNLVDRVRYQQVVDFIVLTRYWPTFNVADIWITAGVILMAIDIFTPRRKPATSPAKGGASARPEAKAGLSGKGTGG